MGIQSSRGARIHTDRTGFAGVKIQGGTREQGHGGQNGGELNPRPKLRGDHKKVSADDSQACFDSKLSVGNYILSRQIFLRKECTPDTKSLFTEELSPFYVKEVHGFIHELYGVGSFLSKESENGDTYYHSRGILGKILPAVGEPYKVSTFLLEKLG
jgi:hypothetical protein